MVRCWIVGPDEAGARLDHHLAARLRGSHAAARRLLDEGAVRVDGRLGRKGVRVQAGQRLDLTAELPTAEALRPPADPTLPLSVLYVDELVVAVAKPAGRPSHPLRPQEAGTVASALVARFPECAAIGDDPRESGLVHRLDIDTSGVLLAARTAPAWSALRRSFSDGSVVKEYLALVAGTVFGEGTIAAPIAHHPRDRRRMIVAAGGAPATTTYRSITAGHGMTLLAVTMTSGRMHQVRVHLAHRGHPLVGDPLYGGPPPLDDAGGHFLHAWRVDAPHPAAGRLRVEAPLPAERAAALARLGLTPGPRDPSR